MDIKKELIKLKKERSKRLTIGIIMLSVGFPIYAISTLAGAIFIIPVGMALAIVGIVLTFRSAFHPNYYNLKGEIAGYDKCQQLHMVPPRGKNEELDKKIRALEDSVYKKGAFLLGGNLRADTMKKEDSQLIKSTMTKFGELDKATDVALFKCYAHLCDQANIGGAGKNKHAVIQKECVFRIIYLRHYELMKKL